MRVGVYAMASNYACVLSSNSHVLGLPGTLIQLCQDRVQQRVSLRVRGPSKLSKLQTEFLRMSGPISHQTPELY